MIATIEAASLLWGKQSLENLVEKYPVLEKYNLEQDNHYDTPRALITIDSLIELKELINDLKHDIVITVPQAGGETARYADFIITIYDDWIE